MMSRLMESYDQCLRTPMGLKDCGDTSPSFPDYTEELWLRTNGVNTNRAVAKV